MNDYEAHLSSYDHSHKQRLRDMKQMVKDPAAIARARKQEKQAEGLISIKLGDADAATSNGGAGFKKGGFKKTGFKSTFVSISTNTGGGAAQDRDQESSVSLSTSSLAGATGFTSYSSCLSLLAEGSPDDS